MQHLPTLRESPAIAFDDGRVGTVDDLSAQSVQPSTRSIAIAHNQLSSRGRIAYGITVGYLQPIGAFIHGNL